MPLRSLSTVTTMLRSVQDEELPLAHERPAFPNACHRGGTYRGLWRSDRFVVRSLPDGCRAKLSQRIVVGHAVPKRVRRVGSQRSVGSSFASNALTSRSSSSSLVAFRAAERLIARAWAGHAASLGRSDVLRSCGSYSDEYRGLSLGYARAVSVKLGHYRSGATNAFQVEVDRPN
jgi:hypothetical protein